MNKYHENIKCHDMQDIKKYMNIYIRYNKKISGVIIYLYIDE